MAPKGAAAKIIDGVNVSAVLRESANANNKLGVRGVHYDARRKRYIAKCQVHGERWTEEFYTLEEAQKAWKRQHEILIEKYNVESKHHGETE